MAWVYQTNPHFKHELDKIIMDYIDFGNCFATVEWMDRRIESQIRSQSGYVGPMVRRISPLDIVMNPTAENFMLSPKIISSIVSLGEATRSSFRRMSNDENRESMKNYMNISDRLDFMLEHSKETGYSKIIYTTWMDSLHSEHICCKTTVEVLTFYGDWYDDNNDNFEKNRVITVIDRHKLIADKPNPSFFGYPPIFHTPWRKKQDNLWGMGPLDNLVGMQYRLDHIENQKADTGDMCNFPVQKIKGFVEDYVWQPGEKIFIGDEGDVEIIQPEINYQNMDFDLTDMSNYGRDGWCT